MRGTGHAQRVHGGECQGDAGLHVERARPAEAVAVTSERHAPERPDGPDRVEVAQEHHRSSLPREAGTEMVPPFLLRQHVDGCTGLAQHVSQDGSAAIDRRLVRAG